jgi:hypothetical protein
VATPVDDQVRDQCIAYDRRRPALEALDEQPEAVGDEGDQERLHEMQPDVEAGGVADFEITHRVDESEDDVAERTAEEDGPADDFGASRRHRSCRSYHASRPITRPAPPVRIRHA